jgi:thioredoxin:protein disulfide reductase
VYSNVAARARPSQRCVGLRPTFKDSRVIAATARFVMLWIDASDDEAPEVVSMKEKYKLVGLPTLVIIDRKGKQLGQITEFLPGETLATVLQGGE